MLRHERQQPCSLNGHRLAASVGACEQGVQHNVITVLQEQHLVTLCHQCWGLQSGGGGRATRRFWCRSHRGYTGAQLWDPHPGRAITCTPHAKRAPCCPCPGPAHIVPYQPPNGFQPLPTCDGNHRLPRRHPQVQRPWQQAGGVSVPAFGTAASTCVRGLGALPWPWALGRQHAPQLPGGGRLEVAFKAVVVNLSGGWALGSVAGVVTRGTGKVGECGRSGS